MDPSREDNLLYDTQFAELDHLLVFLALFLPYYAKWSL